MQLFISIILTGFIAVFVPAVSFFMKTRKPILIKDAVFYSVVAVWLIVLSTGVCFFRPSDWSISDIAMLMNSIMIVLFGGMVFAQYNCGGFRKWMGRPLYVFRKKEENNDD